MSAIERIVGLVTNHPLAVLLGLLALTAIIGIGAADIEETAEMEMFAEEPPEVQAEHTVEREFSRTEANTSELVILVENETGNVLSKESLLASLEYQRTLLNNETVNATLLAEGPTFGIENLVATGAIALEAGEVPGSNEVDQPPIDEQIAALAAIDETTLTVILEQLLDPQQSQTPALTERALELMPASYEPGSTTADGRLTIVTHETDEIALSAPELPEEVQLAQQTALVLADDVPRDDYRLSGHGLMISEEHEAMNDSFMLAGPMALLFVLVALSIAYRDPVDLLFGMLGVLLVLVLTFGAMGWLGIDFQLMLIATPVLLIGLSIDYCIHVIMRYRERRAGNGVETDADDAGNGVKTDMGDAGNAIELDADDGSGPAAAVRPAMGEGLTSLGPALILVTLTAMIGFLSIVTSGVPAFQDFAVVTAIGIAATLVVFGALIPAMKVLVDARLVSRGHSRTHRAFGTTGRPRRFLEAVASASYRRPLTIVVVVLLFSTAGAVAGANLDSDFSTEDYVPDGAPGWTDDLPGPLATGEYQVSETNERLFANYQSPDQQIHVLIEGNVTDPASLQRVDAAEQTAANRSVTLEGPTGDPAVEGPILAMREVAERNATFAAVFNRSDTTGDGVPDRNVSAVLDSFQATAPDRAQGVLLTGPDEDEVARIGIVVDATVDPSDIVDEMDDVAAAATADGPQAETNATLAGQPVVNELIQRQLAWTTVVGLTVALVVVLLVLMVAFRYKRASASLGAVTLLPVLFGLSWILGSMYLLGIPFSFATALIGSVTIGLGVDYAIHISERFGQELDRHDNVERALQESIVGTGGALLTSSVTTAGGFGILAFSLIPVMQQFGLILALTLVFAFVASVIALPSLLVLWNRYLSPREAGSSARRPRRLARILFGD